MKAEHLGTFADEAEARLAALAAGLRRLDSGLDPELIAALVRDAHTITGAAAAVGCEEVRSSAQILEVLLEDIRTGTRPASATLVDTLVRTVDGLRTTVRGIRDGRDVSEIARPERAALEALAPSPGGSPSPVPTGVLRCLLVRVEPRTYALPMHAVITAAEGLAPVSVDGEPVEIVSLGALLEPEGSAPPPAAGPVVVVVGGVGRPGGFRVDALVGLRDVVVKPIPAVLPPMTMLVGAGIEPDGSLLYVLNGPGLVDRAQRAATPPP